MSAILLCLVHRLIPCLDTKFLTGGDRGCNQRTRVITQPTLVTRSAAPTTPCAVPTDHIYAVPEVLNGTDESLGDLNHIEVQSVTLGGEAVVVDYTR